MKSIATLSCLTVLLVLNQLFIATDTLAQDSKKRSPRTERQNKSFGEDKKTVYKSVEGRDLNLYVFIPNNRSDQKPRPAIVFFFGGGWVGGSPSQFKPHAQYLKSRGMVAVLADYRTKKSHDTSPKECVADAKSAVRFLRSNAKKFGMDPNRIVASGGSAGGHIAAATATVTEINEPGEDTKVSCIPNALILFNPVYDNGPKQWGHKKVKEYWQQISPAANIRKGMPPAIVFLGDKDKLISVATAKSFQSKMKDVGSKSELHIYEGKAHGFFNFGRDKNKPFIDTVTKADQFLIDLKYLEGKPTVKAFVDGREH